jgi:hypothetical protein
VAKRIASALLLLLLLLPWLTRHDRGMTIDDFIGTH